MQAVVATVWKSNGGSASNPLSVVLGVQFEARLISSRHDQKSKTVSVIIIVECELSINAMLF
jgi:hypothetical protein